MVNIKRKELNAPLSLGASLLSFICPIYAYYRICTKRDSSVGAKVVNCIAFTVFWVYALSLMLFVFWSIYNSLKDGEVFHDDKISLPRKLKFSNYTRAYDLILDDYGNNLVDMFVNSTWFAFGSSFLSVLMHAVTGYIFAKYNFPAKGAAFSFVLFTLAIPIVGSLPSMYKVVVYLGLEESPLFLATYLGGFGSNFLIMYAYFKGIDKTYMEAAEIDGASRFGIFFKIMMPLAFAPCFSLFLLMFIGQWNNYETVLIFLETMPTLSSGLYLFESYYAPFCGEAFYQTISMAGVVMASIPVVILVVAFGDKIMSNVSMGGIKG